MDSELESFLEAVFERYGFDFRNYSRASLKRRIDSFLKLRKLESIAALQDLVLANEKELERFVEQMSVTVTELFRDPEFFRSVRRNVLPRLQTYPVIKVWIAGCATGEEAYSVAIMLEEAKLLERSKIYATDINASSLAIARKGVYELEKVKQYAKNYEKTEATRDLSDFFVSAGESAMFCRRLKDHITFAIHNLTTDHSFNEFHLILCRNVLIYFNQELQNRVIRLFNDSLATFGFLCLGNKESLHFSDSRPSFREIDGKEKIFMKMF